MVKSKLGAYMAKKAEHKKEHKHESAKMKHKHEEAGAHKRAKEEKKMKMMKGCK